MWSNPYNVPDNADRIQANNIEVENWSENVLLWLNDGALGVAIYAHMSVVSTSPRLLEGVLAVTRPDGKVLVHRSIGRCETPGKSSSGALTVECLQPNRRWRLKFDGVMQEASEEEIARSADLADARVPVSLDVTFDAVHPVWSLGDEAADQDWGHFHVQQGGAYQGSLQMADETVWINCKGLRDHSYGPRDYSGLQGTSWVSCVFPSGRTVMAMRIWSDKIPKPVSRGFVASGQQIDELDIDLMPDLTSTMGDPREVVVTGRAGGRAIRLTGRGEHVFSLHFMRPIGNAFGYRPIDGETCIDVHCPAQFESDGEIGYGWLNRIRRVEYLTGQTRFPYDV